MILKEQRHLSQILAHMYLHLLFQLRHRIACSCGGGCKILIVSFSIRVSAQSHRVLAASLQLLKLSGQHLVSGNKVLLHNGQMACFVLVLFLLGQPVYGVQLAVKGFV